jgi:hypothetical protein
MTGISAHDYFGYSIDINSKGDTVIIGAYGDYNYTGYAKVYKFISGLWKQYGDTLIGEKWGDKFGISVSINGPGNIIAIGACSINDNTSYVKIYKYILKNWVQQGSTILSESTRKFFSSTLAINSIGDTVVIGLDSKSGFTKVYKFKKIDWVLQGNIIISESINDYFGHSVAINSKGDTVIIGAYAADNYKGYVKVLKCINNKWVQQGVTLLGESENEHFGRSVSINSSGDIIVIGAYGANNYRGYAVIYKYISDVWTQIGAKLEGNYNKENFGISVDINSTGDIVIIGADNAYTQSGYVSIFKYELDDWVQYGNTLIGENEYVRFGNSTGINSSGDIIAVGAYNFKDATGYIEVYALILDKWTLKIFSIIDI